MLCAMHRRDFFAASAAGVAAVLSRRSAAPSQVPASKPFQLHYAPHFGMFANHAPDLLDQLQFAKDQGFSAFEDNGMAGRSKEEQQRIADKMQALDLMMGVFVATADFEQPLFTSGRKDFADKVLADMQKAVEVARRVRAKWCTVVIGTDDPRQKPGFQTANVVDLLKRCADIAATAELTMVLEPLNFRDHPRLFLTTIEQGYEICRAVGSPWCKLLDDLYHQQVSEGNLIPNMDRAWDEIAYFQVGDNPGRCEPGSGEVNYRNVFKHIHDKGFTGILGMEHGKTMKGKEGELRLLDAYRQADGW